MPVDDVECWLDEFGKPFGRYARWPNDVVFTGVAFAGGSKLGQIKMDESNDLPLVSANIETLKTNCAIQEVRAGTTEELYRTVLQEYKSVGANTWEDCCNIVASRDQVFYKNTDGGRTFAVSKA